MKYTTITLWQRSFRYLELFAFLKLIFISGIAQCEEVRGASNERPHQSEHARIPSQRERNTTDHQAQLQYHPFEGRHGGKIDVELHRLRNDFNRTEFRNDNTTDTAQSSTLLASFPTHIPSFPVRNYNGSEVAANRMKLLRRGERQTMKKYKESLQCAEFEPEIELGECLHTTSPSTVWNTESTAISNPWTRPDINIYAFVSNDRSSQWSDASDAVSSCDTHNPRSHQCIRRKRRSKVPSLV
jgi:hypothetical protein